MLLIFLMLTALIVLGAFIVSLYNKRHIEACIAAAFITVVFLFGTLATTAYKVEVAKEETAVTLGWTAFTQEELNDMSRNEMGQYPCIGFHHYYLIKGE